MAESVTAEKKDDSNFVCLLNYDSKYKPCSLYLEKNNKYILLSCTVRTVQGTIGVLEVTVEDLGRFINSLYGLRMFIQLNRDKIHQLFC